MDEPSISVIIPAFNEEDYLPETLNRLVEAGRYLKAIVDTDIQIIVVDNASTDRTAEIAESAGATLVLEEKHNVARVRNTGAKIARNGIMVFLDADTLVPSNLLHRIAQEMEDPMAVGGAVDCLHQSERVTVRAYLKFWRVIGIVLGTAQGGCQFCRRSVFQKLGGYDDAWYMGEDVDFYWRLKRFARQHDLRTSMIQDLQVIPSPRRWNRWPLWRILIWTNPIFAFVFRRKRSAWPDWYSKPLR